MVHYGDYVCEALARACAGGEDVVVPVVGSADGLGLVAVEPEGDALATVFAGAENSAAFVVENALVDQVDDPITCLERGIELDEGIRP